MEHEICCQYCGKKGYWSWIGKCPNCYEVEHRLKDFLSSENGRLFALKLLSEKYDYDFFDSTAIPPTRKDIENISNYEPIVNFCLSALSGNNSYTYEDILTYMVVVLCQSKKALLDSLVKLHSNQMPVIFKTDLSGTGESNDE